MRKTTIGLLTGFAGLGFLMMGCPPVEEPPPGERIVEPMRPPTEPTTPMPPPRDYPEEPLHDPYGPPPTDPQDPPPLDPEDPMEPEPVPPPN